MEPRWSLSRASDASPTWQVEVQIRQHEAESDETAAVLRSALSAAQQVRSPSISLDLLRYTLDLPFDCLSLSLIARTAGEHAVAIEPVSECISDCMMRTSLIWQESQKMQEMAFRADEARLKPMKDEQV